MEANYMVLSIKKKTKTHMTLKKMIEKMEGMMKKKTAMVVAFMSPQL
jgi:hypothetical protein